MEIVVSNKASQPLYEQIASQIKAAIISGELQAGEAIPSVRSLAKSLQISILTVQKAYATLQEDGFIETTAGKGCYVWLLCIGAKPGLLFGGTAKKDRRKICRGNQDCPHKRNISE